MGYGPAPGPTKRPCATLSRSVGRGTNAATQPFERLNLDFKGPLPSKIRNRYILTVVDEYIRFPFAFPCSDISATAIIQCLCSLFAIFGTPVYIHSDRGVSFMSAASTISTGTISRTTPYNPMGNGQCERYNGSIWKTVQLAASNNGCSIDNWEDLLSVALYAIRSLLCTATNVTPTRKVFTFPATEFGGSFASILALSTRYCVSETTCTLNQERSLGRRGRAYRVEPPVRSSTTCSW